MVVISTEVVVELLNSLKFDSIIGFVIMVVVSIANVVGTVVTISLDSVASSCGTGFPAFAVLPAVSAFGFGSLTRDISILTPPSTVLNIIQR